MSKLSNISTMLLWWFTWRFISFKLGSNRFQTYFRTGSAKSVWNRFETFWLRSHDGQIDWNRFQINLKVSCEQGDSHNPSVWGIVLPIFSIQLVQTSCISLQIFNTCALLLEMKENIVEMERVYKYIQKYMFSTQNMGFL